MLITAPNVRLRKLQQFSKRGGFVFSVTPFFLWAGGGGGCLKASGGRDGWVTQGGGFTIGGGFTNMGGGGFPVKKFDVDNG